MGSGLTTALQSFPDRVTFSSCQELLGAENITTERFNLFADKDHTINKNLLLKIINSKFDVFLTHNWSNDDQGRNNHERVSRINAGLKERHLVTWFDEEKMIGRITDQMCGGIDESHAVVVFITRAYIEKVGSSNDQDNCKLEFGYAQRKKGSSLMIPVVMEDSVKSSVSWGGPVGMLLGGSLYEDMSSDDNFDKNIDDLVNAIVATMKHKIADIPGHQISQTVSKVSGIISSVSMPELPTISKPIPTVQNTFERTLLSLSIQEIQIILDNMSLSKYKESFTENNVSGELLATCDNVDEVKELGITITAQAKLLFSKIQEWKTTGIPDQMLIPIPIPIEMSTPIKIVATEAITSSAPQSIVAHPVAEVVVADSPKKKEVTYPSKITFNGMPFEHAGWNGEFIKQTNRLLHGKPVYKQDMHFLLFVPIAAAIVEFDGNNWILRREDSKAPMHYSESKEKPLGAWDSGISCR